MGPIRTVWAKVHTEALASPQKKEKSAMSAFLNGGRLDEQELGFMKVCYRPSRT